MSYSAEILADSPYAYWRLGEASGATAEDASPNNRDGVYNSSPTYGQSSLIPSDPGDTCVDLGPTSYVQSGFIFNSGVITMNVWYDYSGTPPASNAQICGLYDGIGSVTQDKYLFIDSSGHVSAYCFTSGAVTATDPNALSAGPHMITMRQDMTTLKLYIDGVEVASTGLTGPSFAGYSQNNVFVAAHGNGFLDLAGRRDEFAIWDSAVTISRIADWYAAATATDITDSATVYLDLEASGSDIQAHVDPSTTVQLTLTPSATEVAALSSTATIWLRLRPSAVEYQDPARDSATILVDMRVMSQEEGAFEETWESIDLTKWRFEDPLDPDPDTLKTNLANLSISRKHASEGPSSLRVNYETMYTGSNDEDEITFGHSFGFFVQWIDELLGGSNTREYWLTYTFRLERWSDLWKHGLGEDTGDPGAAGNAAFLGVITLPGFAMDENFNDYDTPFVLQATAYDAGDLVLQYPYTLDSGATRQVNFTAGVTHSVKIMRKHNVSTGDFETKFYLDGVLIDSVTDNDGFPPPNPPMGINIFQTQSRVGGIVYIDEMVYSVDAEPRDLMTAESGDGSAPKQMLKMRDAYSGFGSEVAIEVDPDGGAVSDCWVCQTIYIPGSLLSSLGSNEGTRAVMNAGPWSPLLDEQMFNLKIRNQGGVPRFALGGNLGFSDPISEGWYRIEAHLVTGATQVEVRVNGKIFSAYIESLHIHPLGTIDRIEVETPSFRDDDEQYFVDERWWVVEEVALSLDGPVRADNYDFRFPFKNVEIDEIAYLVGTVGDPPSYPPYWMSDGEGNWSNSLIEGFPDGPGLPSSTISEGVDEFVYLDLTVSSVDEGPTGFIDTNEVRLTFTVTSAFEQTINDVGTVYLELSALGGECHSTWSGDFLGEGDAYVGLVGNAEAAFASEAEADWDAGEVFLGDTVNC